MDLEDLKRLKAEGRLIFLPRDRRYRVNLFVEPFFEKPRTIDEARVALGYKQNHSTWCSLRKKERSGVLTCFVFNGEQHFVLTSVWNSLKEEAKA